MQARNRGRPVRPAPHPHPPGLASGHCILYTVYTMGRDNLSQLLADDVRARVVSGALVAGQRINEVHLARDLAVSRTPLREALTRLAGEDLIAVSPRLGFSVPPLSVDEVLQLYPIRATLDPWALRLAGVPARPALRALEALNRAMIAAADDVARVIELDDQFHMELLAGCPNRVLLGLIRQMMWRTRRYEHLYFSERRHVVAAVRTHRALLARLKAGELDGACRLLADNMQTASPALLAAIRAQTGGAR